MLLAIEGCCHGELDKIYETLDLIQKDHGKKVDLLICCGDFQAVRNVFDLSCMAVPAKYLSMQTFHKYYTGEKQASVLTIFIGGNHEASNHLQELSYGGWVAPNIYYLGNAGVINFGGLRVGGISGIYKGHDYIKGHHEVPPYTEDSKRSIYHVRQLEVFRLKQISRSVDIFVSHDWPNGVTDHGDAHGLMRYKPFLREELEKGQLGNPATWDLLQKLRPRYWFSAHMHAKFAATIPHKGENAGETKFLALDKCLPGKRFLQVLDISPQGEAPAEHELSFDAEWLGILKDTNHLWHFEPTIQYLPGPGGQDKHDFTQLDEDIEKTKDILQGTLNIDPSTFQRIAPAHESTFGDGSMQLILKEMKQKDFPVPPVKAYINPQTTWLCEKLGITDPLVELIKIRKISYEKPEVKTQAVVDSKEGVVDESVEEKPTAVVKPENGYAEDVEPKIADSTDGVNGTDEPTSKKIESVSSETVAVPVDENETSEPEAKKLKRTDEAQT